MGVLWEHGPSTAAEVQERLTDRLAYTTVLTVLRVLETKGHVAHVVEGKAHRFRPTVTREATARSAAMSETLSNGPQGQPEARVDGRADGSPLDAQLDTMMGDAPVCDVCGHITVRNGACYKCLNCGNSMGCS